jgi:hypothetical protein
MLKGEALVPIPLHRLNNRCKWDLQTDANAPVSTSGGAAARWPDGGAPCQLSRVVWSNLTSSYQKNSARMMEQKQGRKLRYLKCVWGCAWCRNLDGVFWWHACTQGPETSTVSRIVTDLAWEILNLDVSVCYVVMWFLLGCLIWGRSLIGWISAYWLVRFVVYYLSPFVPSPNKICYWLVLFASERGSCKGLTAVIHSFDRKSRRFLNSEYKLQWVWFCLYLRPSWHVSWCSNSWLNLCFSET